jgi:PilZ domain
VTEPSTVIIGAAELLPALKERAASVNGDVLAFSDAEALRALEAITRLKPTVIALERLFAVTPRGAALINRIKADPSLRASEIRVLEHNSDYVRIVPRPSAAPAAPAVDQRGTRRAPRVKIADRVTVMVDGRPAALVDLSTVGAQVVASDKLKPNQRVDVALVDGGGSATLVATVVWTAFETTGAGARYRGGLDFIDADPAPIAAYAERHKA